MIRAFRETTGLEIRDGYGQTETGQLTGNPLGEPVRPGSMGRPLPGVELSVEDGELVLADPGTDPTFFVGYLDGSPAPADRPWRTGDRVAPGRRRLPVLRGPDRRRDHLGRATGSGRSRSSRRWSPTRRWPRRRWWPRPTTSAGRSSARWSCCATGSCPADALAAELQEHVKAQTAPYKYPRIVEFADELPKTASGKIQRASLRRQWAKTGQ